MNTLGAYRICLETFFVFLTIFKLLDLLQKRSSETGCEGKRVARIQK
jgi:hypothetical protein